MKALVLAQRGKLAISEKERPAACYGDLLIRIKAAALNHRDQWIREDRYSGIKEGVTIGSDAAGIVEAAGCSQDDHWVGKEVVINPNINWGPDPSVQAANYQILGMPSDGTLAEFICVPNDRVHKKPPHLSLPQAAALPLGGLTAYRALFVKGGLKAGEKILINGIGGGVAQFAFQFAIAAGAEVWVTSGQDEKINFALQKGASGGFNYKDSNWSTAVKEGGKAGFDLVIDSAGGDQLNRLIDVLRPGGRLVIFGATTGVPSSLDLRKIFWKQLKIQGSTMGNDREFEEMLQFVSRHEIEPIMEEPLPFERIIDALDMMREGKQMGKLVLVMN